MVSWICKPFDQLSLADLYSILRLRSEVFIVEQTCAYQDLDNKDQQSWHLMGWQDSLLCAYTRLIPPGISYPEASIGRVVTSGAVRRLGIGKELMEKSIEEARKLYGNTPIRIGAQVYLEKFYTTLGFIKSSDVYMEDGIPHIEMLLQ
jgi:ElaA protein